MAGAVGSANPDVYTVSFTGSGQNIVATYKVSVNGAITDAEVVAMFDALVAGALDGTTIAGKTLIAGSVQLGSSKRPSCFLILQLP